MVVFDLKTMVGELCTPQKHQAEGKEILSFNIGIGRQGPTDYHTNLKTV